jgi:hypothetical protein
LKEKKMNTEKPHYRSIVDQEQGDGTNRYTDVVTSWSDLVDDVDWDNLSPKEQKRWDGIMSDVHEASVELAECDPAIRQLVGWPNIDGDLEDLPERIRQGIKEAKAIAKLVEANPAIAAEDIEEKVSPSIITDQAIFEYLREKEGYSE